MIRKGDNLDKYQITAKLGEGGMGAVYEAQDTLLKRAVAIKVLAEEIASDQDALQRFLLEARASAQLNHPNVVAIYEVDKRDGTYYIVMELVRGGSAQASLYLKGAYSWLEATRVAADACRGLGAAHAAGLIHRDIKPANIMCSSAGAAKLADFGLVKSVEADTSLTKSGTVVGTPFFMSPEQCRSEELDFRSDIYALGATYYALLVGKPPYQGNPMSVMFAHCSSPIPDPRAERADVPDGCFTVVQKAMAKEPMERYPSAARMLADLEALLGQTPVTVAMRTGKTQPARTTGPSPGASAATTIRYPPRRSWWFPIVFDAVLAGLALAVMAFLARAPNQENSQTDWRTRWDSLRAETEQAIRTKEIGIMGEVHERVTSFLKALEAEPVQQDLAQEVRAELARLELARAFRARITAGGFPLKIGGRCEGMAFSPDGKWFAAGHYDGSGGVRVWNWDTGTERIYLWKKRRVRGLAFSPDGKTLTATSVIGVLCWDVGSGREWDLPVEGTGGLLRAVAFSPDGKILAAGLNHVHLWNFPDRRHLHELEGHVGPIWSLAFSTDGQILASAGSNGVVKLWDPSTGQLLRKDLVAGKSANCVTFSPASNLPLKNPGSWLGVASNGGIQFWNQANWTKTFDLPMTDVGKEMMSLAYSPDGRFWAAGSKLGPVILHNNVTGRFRSLIGHEDGVCSLAFSPDGKCLITGSWDKTIRLWDLSGFLEN